MARGVTGNVEHREPADHVSLGERQVDLSRRPGPDPVDQPVEPVVGLAVARLHRVDVVRAAPERDPQLLADLLAGALVVRVAVGEGMGVHLVAAKLPQDAPSGVTGRRVNEDVAHEEDVDPLVEMPRSW